MSQSCGELLCAGDPGYDEARAVWNAMHDRRPAWIARCRTAAEVAGALRFATAGGHQVTVRGGGHNVAGAAVADGAVMIDLSPMRGVLVDAKAMVAYADGGCLLRDVDAATARYDLACPSGVVSHTGLGGLALGGGYGWLARTWGLTCDHIAAAQVVLADGSIIEASDAEHQDLLWALRGGGGHFGVVTRFTLRLRPVGPLYYHVAQYPLQDAARALAAYRAFAERQPRALHTVGALKRASGGAVALRLSSAWFGDPPDGPPQVVPLLAAAPAASAIGRVISYGELQALGDHSEPMGHRYYTKSCYLDDLPAEAAELMLSSSGAIVSERSSIDFEYLRGAIADEPDGDGAFPHRDAPYIVTASAQWTDPAGDAENTAWARDSIDCLSAFGRPGAYANYVQDADWTRQEIYGLRRLRRLAAVKQAYDSRDVLRGGATVAAARPTTTEGIQA